MVEPPTYNELKRCVLSPKLYVRSVLGTMSPPILVLPVVVNNEKRPVAAVLAPMAKLSE